jgi:hypothetical protein
MVKGNKPFLFMKGSPAPQWLQANAAGILQSCGVREIPLRRA